MILDVATQQEEKMQSFYGSRRIQTVVASLPKAILLFTVCFPLLQAADEVLLENGAIIRGTLRSATPEEIVLEMESPAGQGPVTLTVPASNVRRVTRKGRVVWSPEIPTSYQAPPSSASEEPSSSREESSPSPSSLGNVGFEEIQRLYPTFRYSPSAPFRKNKVKIRTSEVRELLAKIKRGEMESPPPTTIAHVPVIPQINRYFCGIASIAMILDYWGIPHGTQPEIAYDLVQAWPKLTHEELAKRSLAEIRSSDWEKIRVNINSTEAYFKARHPVGEVFVGDYTGHPDDFLRLKVLIAHGIPIIVHYMPTRNPESIGHAAVMIGFTETEILLQEPTSGKTLAMNSVIFAREFTDCYWLAFVQKSWEELVEEVIRQRTEEAERKRWLTMVRDVRAKLKKKAEIPFEGIYPDSQIESDVFEEKKKAKENMVVLLYAPDVETPSLLPAILAFDCLQASCKKKKLSYHFYRGYADLPGKAVLLSLAEGKQVGFYEMELAHPPSDEELFSHIQKLMARMPGFGSGQSP